MRAESNGGSSTGCRTCAPLPVVSAPLLASPPPHLRSSRAKWATHQGSFQRGADTSCRRTTPTPLSLHCTTTNKQSTAAIKRRRGCAGAADDMAQVALPSGLSAHAQTLCLLFGFVIVPCTRSLVAITLFSLASQSRHIRCSESLFNSALEFDRIRFRCAHARSSASSSVQSRIRDRERAPVESKCHARCCVVDAHSTANSKRGCADADHELSCARWRLIANASAAPTPAPATSARNPSQWQQR